MRRAYKEINKEETETTINVLYDEELIVIYTNKIGLQKQLKKVLGKPKREDVRGNLIIGSCWELPFSEKTKISQMKILIIEDEYSLADAISETLNKEGFSVKLETDGEKGEEEAIANVYDIILLDVMLPHKDGFSILKELRREKIETPVIMLTAKSEIYDKLNGLENGADDYITKPFHMKELVARIKVILKRNSNIDDTDNMKFGDLTLDLKTGKMKANQNEIAINGKELELLESLLLNKNQIMSRETLANKIWGYDSDAEYNNVEVYVSFLRRKLKILQSNVMITAVRGIGYKLEAKVEK